MKRVTVIMIKSCIALFYMLLICTHTYLISALRYKFLILGTYHLDIIFM
jgi:hypothetical protein